MGYVEEIDKILDVKSEIPLQQIKVKASNILWYCPKCHLSASKSIERCVQCKKPMPNYIRKMRYA